jgi:hypothetical protein
LKEKKDTDLPLADLSRTVKVQAFDTNQLGLIGKHDGSEAEREKETLHLSSH